MFVCVWVCIVFFKQKTAYEMRISDWSSDVCSSDLQNISQIASEIRQFDASDLTKQQYTALDLTKYLASQLNTSGPQGLFLLQATGWDVEKKIDRKSVV